MISEPELVGGEPVPGPRKGEGQHRVPGPRDGLLVPGAPDGGPDGDGTDHGDATVVDDGAGPPTPRGVVLRWGLAGALVASAVWTAGLYLYDTRQPDLGGYGVDRNLCVDAPFTALSRLFGPRQTPRSTVDETGVVDRADCRVDFGPAPRDSPLASKYQGAGPEPPLTNFTVDLTYTLHREADPSIEFDETVAPQEPDTSYVSRRVGGLGGRAYLVTDAGGQPPLLRILDGRAEFGVEVRAFTAFDAETGGVRPRYLPEDLVTDVLAPALEDDMRALMHTLRTQDD